MNRILLALAALALASGSAQAQTLSVQPEQQVRIQAPEAGLRRLTNATVMAVRGDTVIVQTAVRDTVRDTRVLGQYAVPFAHLRRLEVHAGTLNRAGGVARGAVAGGAAGVLGALFHKRFSNRPFEVEPCDPATPLEECPFPAERRLLPYDHKKSAVIIGAGVGLGMVVGALKPGRAWRSVLPGPVDALAGPAPGGGVRVEGTIRF